jgi:hypothetical protein
VNRKTSGATPDYVLTVGTPSIRAPFPDFFGISTALTGGGKYVPELIRFQSLYRLFFNACSNSWRDCPVDPLRLHRWP